MDAPAVYIGSDALKYRTLMFDVVIVSPFKVIMSGDGLTLDSLSTKIAEEIFAGIANLVGHQRPRPVSFQKRARTGRQRKQIQSRHVIDRGTFLNGRPPNSNG